MNNSMGLPNDITATRFNEREYQVQRKNHFTIKFNSNFVPDGIEYLVVNFPLPKESTETFKANYWNDSVNLAGKTSFDTTQIVLRDAINYDTEKKFMQWRLRVYNPKTGKVGYAEDYKSDAIVKEYSPSGDIVRSWQIIGCFPTSVDYGDLSYDDGGEKQVSVTLSYDKAYRSDIDDIVAGLPTA